MANVTTNTVLSSVIDNQPTVTSVSLAGVPGSVSTLITNRTFTALENYVFKSIPHVSFVKTRDPSSYSSTAIKNPNGSYSFTIKYLHALSPPTTDIIEFFAVARADKAVVGGKIYGWTMDTRGIRPNGESRIISINGDPGAKLKLRATQHPRILPNTSSVDILKESIVVIGLDGKYETTILFPSSTLAGDYKVVLTEYIGGIFKGGIGASPISINLTQNPIQQTKLEIIETGTSQSWVLPAASINNAFLYYSKPQGATSYQQDFSFTCTHANDISIDQSFVAARFTQVTGQGSTLTEDTVDSVVTYNGLSVVIDNVASPNTVVISGKITIRHGYDAGGHTYITLNINDILNHA